MTITGEAIISIDYEKYQAGAKWDGDYSGISGLVSPEYTNKTIRICSS